MSLLWCPPNRPQWTHNGAHGNNQQRIAIDSYWYLLLTFSLGPAWVSPQRHTTKCRMERRKGETLRISCTLQLIALCKTFWYHLWFKSNLEYHNQNRKGVKGIAIRVGLPYWCDRVITCSDLYLRDLSASLMFFQLASLPTPKAPSHRYKREHVTAPYTSAYYRYAQPCWVERAN